MTIQDTGFIAGGTFENTAGGRTIIVADEDAELEINGSDVLIIGCGTTQGYATVRNTGTINFVTGTIINTVGSYCFYDTLTGETYTGTWSK